MTTTETDPTIPTTRTARPRRRGRGVTIATGIALLLVVVGCSSSTEGPDPTTTTSGGGGSSTVAPSGTGAPAGEGAPTTVGEGGVGTTATSEVGPLTTLDLDASEQAYVDALSTQGTTGMSEAQTACLAGYSVRAIGVDALQAAGVTPEAMASGDKSFNDLTIDEATATEMVDGFGPCSIDIVAYFLLGIGGSVSDPTVMSCIEGRLTEDVARSLYITAISTRGGGNAMQDFLAPCVK